jgi:hypothetical protein
VWFNAAALPIDIGRRLRAIRRLTGFPPTDAKQQTWAITHMTTFISKLSIGAAALILSASLAVAQTPPPAAAPKAAAAPAKAAPAVKGVPKKASTPEGIACSAQADEKKLHGKERKSFRAKCIRDLKKAAKATPAAKKN